MTALKKKNTAASKKQAKTVLKALQKTQQMIMALMRDLASVKKQLLSLSQKKNMYTALQAQLLSFQKEWVKKMSSPVKSKPKAKAKSKMKAKKRKLAPKMTEMQDSPLSMSNRAQETQFLEIIEIPAREEEEFAQEESVENVS